MATAGPQPLIPSQMPQVETLGPSPVINAMEPQMAPQAMAGAERPPAEVNIREASEGFKQLVNSGLTGDPYDVIQRPGNAPTKAPGKMKLMAWVALLEGRNPGPMIKILETERAAKTWNEFTSRTVPEVNRLTADGQTDKALAAIQQGQARLTNVSPELGALVQPMYAKIYEQQKVQKTADATMAAADVEFYSKSPEYQEANAKLHKAQMKKHEFSRSLPNMDIYNTYMQRSVEQSVTPDPAGRGLYFHDRMGNYRQVQGHIPFDEQQLKGPVGDAFLAMVRKRPDEAANILRDPTHPEHRLLSNIYVQTLGTKSALELSAGQPGDPKNLDALKLQLEQDGVPKEAIAWLVATRGVASGPLGDTAGAAGEHMFRGARDQAIIEAGKQAEELAMVNHRIPLEASTLAMNSDIIGRKSAGEDFGVTRNNMSLEQANNSGGKYIRVNKSVNENQIQPLLSAISIVKNGGQLYKYLGNPETIPEQVATGIWSNIARYFPGAAGPRDVKAEVLRAMIGRALETIESKGANLPDAMRGSMKNLIRGDFSNANAAISGLQQAITIGEQHLDRLMGENSLSVTRPLETPQRQREQISNAPRTGQPSDPFTAITSAGLKVLEGTTDLSQPISMSSNWSQEMASAVGLSPETPVRKLAEFMASMAVADLKNRKIPNADAYLITSEDTNASALEKIRQAQSLLTVKAIPDARPKGKGKLGKPVR